MVYVHSFNLQCKTDRPGTNLYIHMDGRCRQFHLLSKHEVGALSVHYTPHGWIILDEG